MPYSFAGINESNIVVDLFDGPSLKERSDLLVHNCQRKLDGLRLTEKQQDAINMLLYLFQEFVDGNISGSLIELGARMLGIGPKSFRNRLSGVAAKMHHVTVKHAEQFLMPSFR